MNNISIFSWQVNFMISIELSRQIFKKEWIINLADFKEFKKNRQKT